MRLLPRYTAFGSLCSFDPVTLCIAALQSDVLSDNFGGIGSSRKTALSKAMDGRGVYARCKNALLCLVSEGIWAEKERRASFNGTPGIRAVDA